MDKKKMKKCAVSLLVGTAVLHTFEWFTIGKDIAEAAKVPQKEAMVKCLLLGIIWWKPLKESLVHMQPLDKQEVAK